MFRHLTWLVAVALFLLGGCDAGLLDDDDTSTGDDDTTDPLPDDDVGDDDSTVDDDSTADDDSAGDDDSDPTLTCLQVTYADDQLAVLQIDPVTGDWSELGRYGSGFAGPIDTMGLGYLDGALVLSNHDGSDGVWTEVDLASGAVQIGSDSSNTWIASSETDLHTICQGDSVFCTFPDFAALSGGNPSTEIYVAFTGFRFAVAGGFVFVAWHSTSSVDVHDLGNGTFQRTIYLEGYDGWVNGIAVVGETLFLYQDTGDRIATFDTSTGSLIGDVYLSNLPYQGDPDGLWCGMI